MWSLEDLKRNSYGDIDSSTTDYEATICTLVSFKRDKLIIWSLEKLKRNSCGEIESSTSDIQSCNLYID